MWVQGLLAAIQVLPALVETIALLTKQVEPESPSGGGEAQKKAVVGLVKAGVEAADKFDPDGQLMSQAEKDAIVDVAGQATDLMVDLYNTVGTFRHGERAS